MTDQLQMAPLGGKVDPALPAWETALFNLLHPAQIAIIEACLWIGEPLSATLLVEVFDSGFTLNLVAYHVRRLYERGIIDRVDRRFVRGAIEHFYCLAAELQVQARRYSTLDDNGLAR